MQLFKLIIKAFYSLIYPHCMCAVWSRCFSRSTWDSRMFLKVITSRGGRFLEAPVSGSQQLSNDGMLVIVAAGDRTVYEDCSSCFQAMGKTSFFLGTLHTRFSKWGLMTVYSLHLDKFIEREDLWIFNKLSCFAVWLSEWCVCGL